MEFDSHITKLDNEQRIAYGWASVIEENGVTVTDKQGDIIPEATLLKAVHDFIEEVRAGDVMHDEKKVASIVESIVFTHDMQKALGIDLKKVGWFIGMKFSDQAVWEKVKAGEYPMFSIGGTAKKIPITVAS